MPTHVSPGGWSILRTPGAALALAASGLDWICLDAQHGEHDDASVREVCRLLAGRVRVLVRPPSLDSAWIGRALDFGAAGVVVPVVDTPAQAAAAVAACRYPPAGRRSWGPLTGGYTEPGTAPPVTCSIMVETASALADVRRIAATPGVDELFVGPFDLALALGTTVDDLLAADAPEDPLPRIVSAAREHGRVASVFGGTAERSRRLVDLGFTSVAVTTDVLALGDGVRAALETFRR